jgi:hypothetical protein
MNDDFDNCPNHRNPKQIDTLGSPLFGDECECEADWDNDGNVDGLDAAIFKNDFGRSSIHDPCTALHPCYGDFNCSRSVDGIDAYVFKTDFGRFPMRNPCPNANNPYPDSWCF